MIQIYYLIRLKYKLNRLNTQNLQIKMFFLILYKLEINLKQNKIS